MQNLWTRGDIHSSIVVQICSSVFETVFLGDFFEMVVETYFLTKIFVTIIIYLSFAVIQKTAELVQNFHCSRMVGCRKPPNFLLNNVFNVLSIDCIWTRTQNHLVRACFEQGVPWHSGNYRVSIHSETRTWHDKNIQSQENTCAGVSF